MGDRFSEIYVNWPKKLDDDEWYFSNAFESLVEGMSSEEAYNFIPTVVEMILRLDEEFLLWETLYFLMQVYSIADTTQIHPFLSKNWSNLSSHIKQFDEVFKGPFQEFKKQVKINSSYL